MRRGVLAAIAAVTVVAGCATVRDSRVNPFNWFGRSEPVAAVSPEATQDDGRNQVAQVSELFLEPASGGAILRATGLPPTQGWYSGALIEEPTEREGELVFRFVVEAPEAASRQGQPRSREVTVGTFLNSFKLEGVRTITVTGAENARSIRRR